MSQTADASTGTCSHCGMRHGKICPSIRSIEYYENGTVKRIEYMRPVDCMPILGNGQTNFGQPAFPAPPTPFVVFDR